MTRMPVGFRAGLGPGGRKVKKNIGMKGQASWGRLGEIAKKKEEMIADI